MTDQYVAVLLPTANCRQWLPTAIGSILAQGYPTIDLYVADDDRGDADPRIIKEFPTVSFLRMSRPVGPYMIDNILLGRTRSGYVAFQDADDRSHPDRIGRQLQYLRETGLDGCGTWTVNVDISGDPVGYHCPPARVSLPRGPAQLRSVFHPTTLYRRNVLERLGGFDSSTRMGADSEFIFRSLLLFRIGNVQQFLYHRTVHPNSLTQHSDTGFKSTERTQYSDKLFREIDGIVKGERPAPAAGYLLNGTPAPGYLLDGTPAPGYQTAFEILQIGKGNKTWDG